MNYIELINRFWCEVEMKDYKSQEANLYFYLLHYCNRIGWENPFSLPNRRAVLSTGLTEKTLIDVRCRLQARGLIDFKPGKRKAASPIYCFPVEGENGFYFPIESKTESKNDSKTESKSGSKKVSHNKTINYKQKTNRTPTSSLPLFEDEKKGKKGRAKIADPPQFPTLDEVKEYFLSQNADWRLDNWEKEAEIFFNHFNALGWRNTNGVQLRRWDSRANNWILEKEQKKQIQNGISPANRQDTISPAMQRQQELAEYVQRNLGNNDDS